MSVTARVVVEGVETERVFTVERHFRGVSVRDERDGIFGLDVPHAVEALCDRRGWTFVGMVDGAEGAA